MLEVQVDDCLLRLDPPRLVSLLRQEGLSGSTLARLHHLVTKELRGCRFGRVLVVIKSVSMLSENKEDLQTLVDLGLTAKVVMWFEAVHDLLTSDLHQGLSPLMNLTEEFFDYFLLLGQASLPAGQLSVLLLHLADLSLEGGVHFPLRLEAIRTFNSILESLSREEKRPVQSDQNLTQKLSQVAAAVLTVGDYELQVSLSETLCRLTPRRERQVRANQWFPSSDIGAAFCDIRDADFEVDCRRFLNFVNRCHGDQRRVYTFPCNHVFLSFTQLFRPKDDKLERFWIDFNVGSGCVSFFVDDPQSFLWGSIHLLKEDVDHYSLDVRQNEAVLNVRLINPIMHLDIKGHMVELTFDPEHHRELEEASGRVFNKQAGPSGGGVVLQDKHRCRSYGRKKPPSKSQLKILPLSSPSSEDESSLQNTATNRAEVLFDQIQHSTPKHSAGFRPLFGPNDDDDVSEAHLSRLTESPPGVPQGVELQTTQDLTGLEETGGSTPKKENLRKRESADSGYLSDQAEGGTPHKKKAEPLENLEESCSTTKGVEPAEEEILPSEGAWPDRPEQKAEPETHLASDITAAFKYFKAQLEQRFTSCWRKVEAELLGSLKDCQQHVSSLLTAVHRHRLSLLRRFETNVADQLKQLEEDSVHLNAISSQTLTSFYSEMEHLSSFCQEHLKKLEALDPDQLRTACPPTNLTTKEAATSADQRRL